MAEEPKKKPAGLTDRQMDALLQSGKQIPVGGKVPKPELAKDIFAGFSPEELVKINQNLRRRAEQRKK